MIYIKNLPPDIMAVAIERAKHHQRRNGFAESTDEEIKEKDLGVSFTWRDTPERQRYWKNVSDDFELIVQSEELKTIEKPETWKFQIGGTPPEVKPVTFISNTSVNGYGSKVLISKMKPKDRRLAKLRRAEYRAKNAIKGKMLNTLFDAFNWSDTHEKHAYWAGILDKYLAK